MAFATSNLFRSNNGNTSTISGNWSGTAGDAAGSLAIGSGNVLTAIFTSGLSSGTTENPIVTSSTAGATTTLSICYHQTVTNGEFMVEFIG